MVYDYRSTLAYQRRYAPIHLIQNGADWLIVDQTPTGQHILFRGSRERALQVARSLSRTLLAAGATLVHQ